MKRNNLKRKSLIVSCMLYFLFYTLLIVLIYSAFHYLVNQRINEAFFTIDDLLQHEDALVHEEYARIPSKNAQNAAYIIFDEDGKTVYASNRTINEKVFYQDMELIGDYHSGHFFDVFEDLAPDGSIQYLVYLSSYWHDGPVPKALDYCVLDEDYHILEGTLFADRDSLSAREFELLSGISRNNGILEKYVYQNAAGEKRTLAFLSFNLSGKKYDEIIRSANSLWMIGVPTVLLSIILFVILFSRRVKRCIAPLNQTIVSYQKGKENEINPMAVPSEFYDTVSNFKGLVTQLEKTREEKEALYEEKQKLIVDISHDLKTPLTVIQGYAEALSQGRVPPEKQERYLQTIFSKSRLATELVNDLFFFTQMEHPDYPLHLEPVDFTEFVKGFFAEKYTEITDAGFELSADLPEQRLSVSIDRRLMRRFLENLLNNSLKYNPKGSTIFVSMRQDESKIVLTLADDGIGIPTEIADSLFQPFVTGNQARTTGKGTGLGLSIAKRIIEMHAGKIFLINPPHKPYQAEFRIELPKSC